MLSKSLAVVFAVFASMENLEAQLVDGSGQFSQFSVVEDQDNVKAVFSGNSSNSPSRTWGRSSGLGLAGLVSQRPEQHADGLGFPEPAQCAQTFRLQSGNTCPLISADISGADYIVASATRHQGSASHFVLPAIRRGVQRHPVQV